ncbi:MAG: T9SS type A sorting domain-containing protein [Flavobacteriales bacterium]
MLKTQRPPRNWARNCLLAIALVQATVGAHAQDPLWSIGNQQVTFPEDILDPITVTDLPTSFDPDLDDAFEYQGQLPQHTQNIQFDDEGKVLFFIIDNNIYNRDGLLIADGADDPDDRNCEVCFLGGEQVHIIPVPGSCTRFYIIGLYYEDFQRDLQDGDPAAYVRVGVLDVTLNSYISAYQDACLEVNGGFVSNRLQDQSEPYVLHWLSDNVVPEANDEYFGMEGVFRQGAIDFTGFTSRVIHGASVRIDDQGRSILVVRVNQGLVLLQTDHDGVWRLDDTVGSSGALWPFDINFSATDTEVTQRGEMALHYNEGNLTVAWSAYYQGPLLDDDGQPLPFLPHQTLVGRWVFQILPATPVTVLSNIQPAGSFGQNPRLYSLDLYPVNAPPPTDVLNDPILRPCVSGLEFSPNGRYLFFVKSPDLAHPSGGPSSCFGYIDMDWTPQDAPLTYHRYFPFAGDGFTRRLVDTQIGMNVAPFGLGPALYMVAQKPDGTYALDAFFDPDNPGPNSYAANVADLETVGSFTHASSPLTEYRYLNRRHGRSSILQLQQEEVCCDRMVLAKDRSGDITTACDLTWVPGDNAFWDTEEAVHVATELRIKQGAHVMASNMTFKFGENAVMVIEPGASFQCTNCLFTNACEDKRWLGIEAQGTDGQHQWGSPRPTYQAMLVLRGSVVEHAEIGVLAGMRPDLNNGGAYVLCSGATVLEPVEGQEDPVEVWKETIFRNCRQGVMMRRHQNFNSTTGLPMRDRSRFDDVRFTVTADYKGGYDFLHHVNLWAVDGIPFTACTFENTLPDGFFADLGSQGLGHGIYSLDAAYSLRSRCTVPWSSTEIPCPENTTKRSTFIGLDHGIHALQGGGIRSFSVDRAQFTNNIAGVYVDGVVGYKVVNSNFAIGGRSVTLTNSDEVPQWQGRHRGIFSTSSYGMIVDDNELWQNGQAASEGIVIGFNRDNNDMVFRNTARDLERGFIGEGICADPDAQGTVGLHFQCNKAQDVLINFWSRRVGTDEQSFAAQTIRQNQGRFSRSADNEFDQEQGREDFKNTNMPQSPLSYYYAPPDVPYRPIYVTTNGVSATSASNNQLVIRPQGNCASRRLPIGTYPGEVKRMELEARMLMEKSAYADQRYLYGQLIDGGSTDEVLEEIMGAWPQDAWELRTYLLGRSPFLSVEALRSAMEKPGFPAAMKAEVCIANPEASKKEGFLKWLEFDCTQPVSPSLIEAIMASWETRTFRAVLESNMADHHGEMTQAAMQLIEYFGLDEEYGHLEEIKAVWQEIRTPAARYAEALALMQAGAYTDARAVVEQITEEHDLKSKEQSERLRMIELVDLLRMAAADGRNDGQLTSTEQAQLGILANGEYDRPGRWAQNILCFHYGTCLPPLTGGSEDEGNKARRPSLVNEAAVETFTLTPNPARNWTSARTSLDLQGAHMLVRDASGRMVLQHQWQDTATEALLDLRGLAPGMYSVELSHSGRTLHVQKLSVE